MTVMKWGWVMATLYLISLILYVLSSKEPAADTHEEFIKPVDRPTSTSRGQGKY